MSKNRGIIIWLSFVCFLVFAMIVVGGLTRLTHSGLSMVNWRPLMGIVPPLTELDWQKTFDLYKTSPEYQLVNLGMTLAGFKDIFLWEYGHRVLGRLIGLAFFFPWLYFAVRKKLTAKVNLKFAVVFFLGGCQGVMGWYMVKSGLINDPSVCHYRLAAHLSLAFVIIGFLLWYILDFLKKGKEKAPSMTPAFKLFSIFSFLTLCFQIVYGAFTAGLKAGYGFNTYPKMGENWLPPGILDSDSLLHFIMENPWGVQFIHRTTALVVCILIMALWVWVKKRGEQHLLKTAYCLLGLTLLQALLGVMTLVLVMPLTLAVLHQLGAGILFACFIYFLHQVFEQNHLFSKKL